MKTLRFGLSAGLFLAIASAPCLAQTPSCPATTAICAGTTPALPGDEGSSSCYSDYTGGGGNLAFSYPQGTSSISFFHDRVALTTEDIFWFEGSVPGQTINARVALALNGEVSDGDVAHVFATFQVSPGIVQDFRVSGRPHGGAGTGSQTLTQDLSFVVGQTFTIRVALDSDDGAGGRGSLTALLYFEQIPANVLVRSCHGYRQDGPVPTLARSWGSLKSLYR